MLSLMYVPGIDEVDTPFFKKQKDQKAFFDACERWSDDTAYYPPYYMNRIKVPSEAVSLTKNGEAVNYCCIIYDERRFYYFIDSVDYVTDDLIEISITLDTIQTFYFDIDIQRPLVSRMAIKRWGDDKVTINRDYVRENLSDGKMRKISKSTFIENADEGIKWVAIRCSSAPKGKALHINDKMGTPGLHGYYGTIRYALSDKESYYEQTGGCTILVPYGDWFRTNGSVYVRYGNNEPYEMTSIQAYLETLASNSETLSMSYLPYDPFGCTFVADGYDGNPIISIPSETITIGGTDYNWYYMDLISSSSEVSFYQGFILRFPWFKEGKAYGMPIRIRSKIAYVDVTHNFSEKKAYDPKYVPAMCDESYEMISVGDNSGTTMAPLFYSKKAYAYLYYALTLKGDRIYSFGLADDLTTGSFGNVLQDPHNVLLVTNNTIDYDLYTDPWKNYQVNHKGSIVTDWLASGATSVSKIAGGLYMANALSKTPTTAEYGSQYAGLSIGGYQQYKTGFGKYREAYKGRQRDLATGRFVGATYTYTGGNY